MTVESSTSALDTGPVAKKAEAPATPPSALVALVALAPLPSLVETQSKPNC